MSDNQNNNWQIWIDRGGTFTDLVAVRNDGLTRVHKLLSENPAHYNDAALNGILEILELDANNSIPRGLLSQVKLGTTVATNALLERKGEATALVTNTGFSDILRIGYQNRQDLFAQNIVIPESLYSIAIELPGRMNAQGNEVEPFDDEVARTKLSKLLKAGVRSCAIVFIHGYLNNNHELKCLSIAKELGFKSIAISSQTSPLIKLIYRGDTTVVDAYLSPVLNNYIDKFIKPLSDTKVFFMQSNGGLVDKGNFSGKDSLLSGPAGGVVGAAKTCEKIGYKNIVGFDMGGTSTDVSHYSGDYSFKDENIIADTRIRTPVIDIHTVAAGGGSIISFDGERFRVGPDSAGANPGPACYRNGGPLTITDCNLELGRIQSKLFPKVFGKSGEEELDIEIVHKKFAEFKEELALSKKSYTAQETAWGFLEIAIEKMAQAIKKITIERGIDIRNHALCSFGGAGGQHACLIAEKLGIKTVIVHPLAGVLSAVGIGLSNLKTIETKSIKSKLIENLISKLDESFAQLERLSIEKLKNQSSLSSIEKNENSEFCKKVAIRKKLLIKYEGADTSIELSYNDLDNLTKSFHLEHENRYGFKSADKPLIVESIRLEAQAPTSDSSSTELEMNRIESKNIQKTSLDSPVSMYSKGRWHQTPVCNRSSIDQNRKIEGPLIISDETGTNIVEPGWRVSVKEDLSLVIEHSSDTPIDSVIIDNESNEADPIVLELFNNKFMAVAEEMGVTLRNTSHSVNIKERLDFSCAVFDNQGRLIANAPHMPVHLGSMGASVKSVIDKFKGSMTEGDCYILNNPYNGGTHLPDITVITPVFVDSNKPQFFTASRGHHADVGGITPGSMPPNSKHIDEEGILIDPTLMVKDGIFLEDSIKKVLLNSKYPARNPVQNIQDLKAQVAANSCGVAALLKLVESYGLKVILDYMEYIRKNAEFSVRQAIEQLSDGEYELKLDNNATIKVSIKVDKTKKEATVDFTGSSAQLTNSNLNAPSSITRAAVLYVFRTLVKDDIPLNDGCLAPINLIIPEDSMLNPSYPSAVVAGNVETSQSIVDTLYGALGILAASQGTMNNFTFGNSYHQYYETICGGSGAGASHNGTDAIHTHMTNSRLTDPEVLEWRYPVRLKRFLIRKNSGGQGKHRGGDGVVREIEFLEPATASILSQRRLTKPFGIKGGKAGKTGINYVIRRSGKIVELTGTDSIEMESGDSFVIETPGGGGFGHEENQSE